MDSFKVMRSLPILNSSDLFGVHFDALHTDDETQVFDFLTVELILLWFEMQASLLKSF
jgi:hypothetical protein